jgi:ABC-type uncharacterized transport system permease subunit
MEENSLTSSLVPRSDLDGGSRIGQWLLPIFAVVVSFGLSGLFIIFTRTSPFVGYRELLAAGFGCRAPGNCALLTTLQFATPLLLTGLSAAVAFRAGVFSIGQAGQMILGAAAAAWVSASFELPYILHVIFALGAGIFFGAIWGWIPGVLKAYLSVNEVISTLLMNQLSIFAVGFFRFGRGMAPLRFPPLARNTKLNLGLLIAFTTAVLVYVYLRRYRLGYEQRMAGDSPRFAFAGGIKDRRAIVRAMFISGGIAGLAGAIEVLGVHYRFTPVFSGGGGFDGIAVALLGLANPLGIPIAAFILAGLRLGATNGLQMKAQVPRELGGAIIAMMIILVSTKGLYAGIVTKVEAGIMRIHQRWRKMFR